MSITTYKPPSSLVARTPSSSIELHLQKQGQASIYRDTKSFRTKDRFCVSHIIEKRISKLEETPHHCPHQKLRERSTVAENLCQVKAVEAANRLHLLGITGTFFTTADTQIISFLINISTTNDYSRLSFTSKDPHVLFVWKGIRVWTGNSASQRRVLHRLLLCHTTTDSVRHKLVRI